MGESIIWSPPLGNRTFLEKHVDFGRMREGWNPVYGHRKEAKEKRIEQNRTQTRKALSHVLILSE